MYSTLNFASQRNGFCPFPTLPTLNAKALPLRIGSSKNNHCTSRILYCVRIYTSNIPPKKKGWNDFKAEYVTFNETFLRLGEVNKSSGVDVILLLSASTSVRFGCCGYLPRLLGKVASTFFSTSNVTKQAICVQSKVIHTSYICTVHIHMNWLHFKNELLLVRRVSYIASSTKFRGYKSQWWSTQQYLLCICLC